MSIFCYGHNLVIVPFFAHGSIVYLSGSTCRVKSRRESLLWTGRSRVGNYFHVICVVSGIAASSVFGVGKTCGICYWS